jgi:hypothetical protein
VAASGRRVVAAALAIAMGGGLAGCVSTQQKNERAKLVADRELGSRRPLRVSRASAQVRVTDAALVRGRRASAIVVTLRSRARTALVDVPIAVGVRGRGGRRTPLNAGRGLDWFQTHVPAIAAGGRTTWVFLTRRPVPAGSAWARAGAGAVTRQEALPRVEAAVAAVRGADRGDGGSRASGARRVSVAVDNASGIPQYGLQVYALVQRDGRYVAAGKAAVRHLGSGARAATGVALAGRPGRRPVRVHAIPTIFE